MSANLKPQHATPSSVRGLTILLPTLNEVEALSDVVRGLPLTGLEDAGWRPRIVVTDGRSTDGTVELASELGLEVVVQAHLGGKGIGMREAFARFLEGDDHALVMLDADGTYDPGEMMRMLAPLSNGKSVVMGSRLRGRIEPGAMGRFNYVGNHIITWTAVALYRVFVSDVCTGYWAFTRDAVSAMSLNSKSFEIEAEMYTACASGGLAIGEVPITYARRVGESKLGSVRDGVRILRKLLVRRLFPNPVNRV